MIIRTRFPQLCILFGLLMSSTLAWPWPPTLGNLEEYVVRRADKPGSGKLMTFGAWLQKGGLTDRLASDSASSAAQSTAESASGSAKASGTAEPGSSAGSATSKPTPTEKGKSSETNDRKPAKTTPAVDPRLPAGGVNLMTPALTDPTTYYKVSDYVTFGWNYTSLSVEPSKIDVYVTNTVNQAAYTLANNISYAPTGKVVWDTKKNANQTGDTPALIVGEYTLVIHDADTEVSAVASAGYLGSFNRYSFGMYTPQAYTPRPGTSSHFIAQISVS